MRQTPSQGKALLVLLSIASCFPPVGEPLAQALVEPTEYGVFEEIPGKKPKSEDGCPAPTLKLKRRGDAVEATILTRFGLEFTPPGAGGSGPERLAVRLARPPVKNPADGETKTAEVWEILACPGKPVYVGWGFLGEWELAAGEYRFEVRRGETLLVAKSFTVTPKALEFKELGLKYGLKSPPSPASHSLERTASPFKPEQVRFDLLGAFPTEKEAAAAAETAHRRGLTTAITPVPTTEGVRYLVHARRFGGPDEKSARIVVKRALHKTADAAAKAAERLVKKGLAQASVIDLREGFGVLLAEAPTQDAAEARALELFDRDKTRTLVLPKPKAPASPPTSPLAAPAQPGAADPARTAGKTPPPPPTLFAKPSPEPSSIVVSPGKKGVLAREEAELALAPMARDTGVVVLVGEFSDRQKALDWVRKLESGELRGVASTAKSKAGKTVYAARMEGFRSLAEAEAFADKARAQTKGPALVLSREAGQKAAEERETGQKPVQKTAAKSSFAVQAAGTRVRSQAERAAALLNERGWKSYVVARPSSLGEWYAVRVGAFSDLAAADKAAKAFTAKEGTPAVVVDLNADYWAD